MSIESGTRFLVNAGVNAELAARYLASVALPFVPGSGHVVQQALENPPPIVTQGNSYAFRFTIADGLCLPDEGSSGAGVFVSWTNWGNLADPLRAVLVTPYKELVKENPNDRLEYRREATFYRNGGLSVNVDNRVELSDNFISTDGERTSLRLTRGEKYQARGVSLRSAATVFANKLIEVRACINRVFLTGLSRQ